VKNMEVVRKKTSQLIPYFNNPRNNKDAVKYVIKSIKQFGFQNPIIIDKENVVVAGHTRLQAAKELGIKEVPCIVADDISEEQIRAFRIIDNKTAEVAEWDYDKLMQEVDGIEGIDIHDFGFFSFNKIDSFLDDELSDFYSPDDLQFSMYPMSFNLPIEEKTNVKIWLVQHSNRELSQKLVEFVEGDEE